ncbi:MAG: sulfurtransferase TusA family protein [Clostridium sp.]
MHKIDTRGMSCPQPVLMMKKALDEKEACIEVLTDSIVSRNNIVRYAVNNGYNIDESEVDEGTLLIITK